MSNDQYIDFQINNRCGVITLDRPQALNAVNYDMIAALERHYREWAGDLNIYAVVLRSGNDRAFSSGGDIRWLYDTWKAGNVDRILALYGTEYQHNWTLDRFLKPHVALIDGAVMGGGVGISLYGTHRTAGANYRFAMPEVAIGFFPDIGATWFLPRLKGKVGLYLALTARSIGAADAYYLGLVTHCIGAEHHDAIVDALSDAEPVDPLLDGFHEDPGESELAALQNDIDRLFDAGSVEQVLEQLESETGGLESWARAAADDIRSKSPLALKVAFEQMKRGGAMSLDEALKLDFVIARHFFDIGELFEGVRALIVDKDRKPQWNPGSLDAVSDKMVQGFFAPLDDGELELPTS